MTRTAVSLRMYAGALLLLLAGALLSWTGLTTAAVAAASVVAVALLCGAVFAATTARSARSARSAPPSRTRTALRAHRATLAAHRTPRPRPRTRLATSTP